MANVIRLGQTIENGNRVSAYRRDDLPLVHTPFWRRWLHAFTSIFSAEVRRQTVEELRLHEELRAVRLELLDARAVIKTVTMERDKLDGECIVHKAAIDNLNLAITMLDMRYKALIARDAARAGIAMASPESVLPKPKRRHEEES